MFAIYSTRFQQGGQPAQASKGREGTLGVACHFSEVVFIYNPFRPLNMHACHQYMTCSRSI